MTDYIITRSRRKTVAIHITKGATVEVRAPMKVSKADIGRLVSSKQDWISKHLAVMEQRMENRAAFTLDYGDNIVLRGEQYPIIAKSGGRAGFDGKQLYLTPGLTPDEIMCVVIQVYKLTAKQLLTEKIDKYTKLTGLTPVAVKINGAKTRWGSCSGKNNLNFSWRLIMADDDVIDYVVVHELAHTEEHNHSVRFWAIVAAVLPDYKERQERLRELQKRFESESWE